MKKIISIIILLMTFMINMNDVSASESSIKLTTSKTNLEIGDTITVNIELNSNQYKLGSWQFEVKHDDKLTLLDGEEKVADVSDGTISKKIYSLKYKAILPGTSKIYISSSKIIDWDKEKYLSVDLSKSNINFNITELPKTLIQLDSPSSEVEKTDKMIIQGWVMSNATNKKVEVYLDNSLLNVQLEKRDDVLNVITGYGTKSQNPTPGYVASINNRKLSTGNHKITVKVINKNNNYVISSLERNFTIKSAKSKIQIDSPQYDINANTNIVLDGWSMSDIPNKKIEIYLDGTKLENVSFIKRDDVLNAVTGYGTKSQNPTPGFRYTIIGKNLKSGEHTIAVKLVDTDNGETINQLDKKIKIKRVESKIQIDSPTVKVVNNKDLVIQGWTMSNTPNKKVEIYIGGSKLNNVTYQKRDDVINAIKGYGTEKENSTPGFITTVNINMISLSTHKLRVRIINTDNNEVINELIREFTIEPVRTMVQIDTPSEKVVQYDDLKIQGWVMSNLPSKKVEIYLDDKKIDNVTYQKRDDVINAIKDCGTKEQNPTPGFFKIIDGSNLKIGKHTITVKVTDLETSKETKTIKNFEIIQLQTRIQIDTPSNVVYKNNNMIIEGWVMSNLADKKVEVYVDDKKINNVTYQERKDVISAVTGYGTINENKTPGYKASFNNYSLNYGEHMIVVTVINTNTNNIVASSSKKFTLKESKTKIQIDTPLSIENKNNNMIIEGWVMSNILDKKIEIYLDDKKIDNVTFQEREDVLKAITGYGTKQENKTPGYKALINNTKLSTGNHKITVKVLDNNTKEILSQNSKTFTIKPYTGFITIDSPINNKLYKNIINISGWAMSDSNSKHVEAYIDNKKIEGIKNIQREDVLKAITNYGGRITNKTPGFILDYDCSSLKDGNHVLSIKLVDDNNNETIYQTSTNFKIKKYNGIITIDTNLSNNITKDFILSGWEMSELDNSYLKIYIDNNEINSEITRLQREDVLKVITNYGSKDVNPTPGFSTTINVNNYTNGSHTLKIKLFTKLNEEIYNVEKRINISK